MHHQKSFLLQGRQKDLQVVNTPEQIAEFMLLFLFLFYCYVGQGLSGDTLQICLKHYAKLITSTVVDEVKEVI